MHAARDEACFTAIATGDHDEIAVRDLNLREVEIDAAKKLSFARHAIDQIVLDPKIELRSARVLRFGSRPRDGFEDLRTAVCPAMSWRELFRKSCRERDAAAFHGRCHDMEPFFT